MKRRWAIKALMATLWAQLANAQDNKPKDDQQYYRFEDKTGRIPVQSFSFPHTELSFTIPPEVNRITFHAGARTVTVSITEVMDVLEGKP